MMRNGDSIGTGIALSRKEPDLETVPIIGAPFRVGDITTSILGQPLDETVPVREVQLKHEIHVGIVPVTFEQWNWAINDCIEKHPRELQRVFCALGYPYRYVEAILREHANDGMGGACQPVSHINWFAAQAYCWALTLLTNRYYRLPTETEWEYCCRARSETSFAWGEDLEIPRIKDVVNYDRRPPRSTTDLSLPTFVNEFGLRHMHGQVWEWVQDCYTHQLSDAPKDGRAYVGMDRLLGLYEYPRVVRGGSWTSPVRKIRSASRSKHLPDHHHHNVGFRVVMDESV